MRGCRQKLFHFWDSAPRWKRRIAIIFLAPIVFFGFIALAVLIQPAYEFGYWLHSHIDETRQDAAELWGAIRQRWTE